PFTQAAIATAAVDTMVFTAQVPAKLNFDYPLTKEGAQLRFITSVTLALAGGTLTENTDFYVDKELGLIRFINPANLPADTVTPTVTSPAIDAAHDKYMLGVTPMTKPVRRGLGRFLNWD